MLKTALIIPAYEPDDKLLKLLDEFCGDERFLPVIVDDGSSPKCGSVFDAIPEWCILLRHEVNRGKGAALKTAISYILREQPECTLAVTADADGQHRHDDILRVRETALRHPEALVLGSRAFEGDVPLRSRIGNGITRQVFAAASGAKVYDTQTGLRAFGRKAMDRFVSLSGERYEYEINMLLDAAHSGMPILEEKIATVYLNDNESSHFNTVKDSFRIYACILKFGFSSFLAFLVDFVMVLLLKHVFSFLPERECLAVSVVGARIISSVINFLINHHIVFKGNEKLSRAAVKYGLLALCVLVVNYLLLDLLTISFDWPLIPSKLLVETALFVVNFFVQGRVVYRKGK